MNIFVGNLNIQTSEKLLTNLFAPFRKTSLINLFLRMQSRHSIESRFIKTAFMIKTQKGINTMNISSDQLCENFLHRPITFDHFSRNS